MDSVEPDRPVGVQQPARPAPSVIALFDRQADCTPGLPAVLDRGREISYRQLARDSAATARRLVAHGAGPGRIVGMCVDRSADLPLAVLAILRTGAAYLPLDAAYPPERLSFMLADSGADMVVAQPGRLDGIQLPPGTRVVDASVPGSGAAGPQALPVPGPDDLAYVMYTSGSTGLPKGVGMPHAPMSGLISWQCRDSACSVGARTLQFSAASFDASFQEMFSTWASGGCLVMVEDRLRRDPRALLALIERERVERVFMPFVALQALAQEAVRGGVRPSRLREVITAGEQLVVTPALRAFFREMPDTTLFNQYGPSETHIVTSLRLGREPDKWPETPVVGAPIDGASIDIRDAQGRSVPPGATGEICIGGTVLARGYLHRARLTAEKFVPDAAGAPGSRTYRSGDLGCLEDDGTVRWLGRADHQVKISGYRVELGEVEGALKALDGLRDGVVVVHEQPGGGRCLVAYALAETTPKDIKTRLAGVLPAHMVPSAVVVLDRFPLTPSGKVDRLDLSRREVTGSGGGTQPGAADERWAPLARLWGEVAGATEVGPDDSFFDIGGTSLSATLLLARLAADPERTRGTDIDLETLYDHPTPAALTAWLAGDTPGTGHTQEPGGEQR
ncbi:non-ribosomal peptide synthetase [Streptomyces sp. NPDC001393]